MAIIHIKNYSLRSVDFSTSGKDDDDREYGQDSKRKKKEEREALF
jgi:hypothetical protein